MEYERLTKRADYDKNIVVAKEFSRFEDYLEFSNFHAFEAYKNILNRLAEIEDKIENGTLIELPCKVGDTVYVIIKAENGYALLKDICDGFMIKDGELFIGLQTYNVGANKYYFTREEAEKRLKEIQNG